MMIPDPSRPLDPDGFDNVVPFPPQPPPPARTPPWPGSQLDEGQLVVNALLALWWGYGWHSATEVGAVAPPVDYGRLGWMGFDPSRRFPRWGIPDAFLGLLAFFLGSLIIALPVYYLTRDEGVLNIAALLGSWIGVMAYVLFASRVRGQGTLSLDFGFRFRWIDLPIGIGLAIATFILSTIVRVLVALALDVSATSNTEQIFSGQNNGVGVVVLALMAAIGAPFVEEILFRGLIFRSFAKRLGTVAGVLISGCVFGLLHWSGANWQSALSLVAGLSVYGILFAIAARWTGRLGASIWAHLLLNSLAAAVTVQQYFSGAGIG